MSEVKTPWKDYMGDVPMHLDYFRGSMFEAVERMADMYPNNIAFDFMGKSTTYKKMVQEIEKCAKSLKTLGVRLWAGNRLMVSRAGSVFDADGNMVDDRVREQLAEFVRGFAAFAAARRG